MRWAGEPGFPWGEISAPARRPWDRALAQPGKDNQKERQEAGNFGVAEILQRRRRSLNQDQAVALFMVESGSTQKVSMQTVAGSLDLPPVGAISVVAGYSGIA